MEPPLGVFHDFRYVCKLNKALYSLKRAPRAWFEKFTFAISIGFVASGYDFSIFLSALIHVISCFLYILTT